MAQNRAAQDLAALTDATRGSIDREAQQRAAEDTRRGTAAASQPVERDEEASFSLPEALATGVAAGWILGPVGGIALGVAQGILGKNAKQNALDQFAAEQDVISGVSDTIGSELDSMEASASNDDDLDQVSNMKTAKAAAIELMTSASPRLQEQGAQMLAKLQGDMTAYAERQETQRIAENQMDAQLRRELDQEQYDRFNGLKVRFDNESAQYEEVLGATNVAIEALNEGTPAQLWAAGILVNKALDPTGVVRTEEAEAVGKLGSLWTKAAVILEKAKDGTTILPQERRDLQGLLTQIQDGASQIQLARESRYLTELEDADVPQKYWDNFTLVDSVPAAQPVDIPDQGEDAPLLEQASDAVTVPVTNAIEGVMNNPNRRQRNNERMLISPGLWQPGGRWGRDLTTAEKTERDRLIRERGRPTN